MDNKKRNNKADLLEKIVQLIFFIFTLGLFGDIKTAKGDKTESISKFVTSLLAAIITVAVIYGFIFYAVSD